MGFEFIMSYNGINSSDVKHDTFYTGYMTCYWATSWENLFMEYANNKGADQPVHPRSLISAIVVRCLDSIIALLAIAEISRP